MKRLTVWMAGLVVLAGTAAGQQHPATMSPYRSMPAPVNASPFGNILFPGGTPASHPMALGATVAGVPYTGVGPGGGNVGHGGGYGGRPSRARTVVVPYAVPVWSGGYYGYGEQQQQPNVTVVMPQQPAPSVIINHHYSSDTPRPTVTTETAPERGGLRVYEAAPQQSASAAAAPRPSGSFVRDDKPNIYLIALKDGTVRQAIGYWSKDGALHYVTPAASIQQISLADVDREATSKLNADRKLEFDLPIE